MSLGAFDVDLAALSKAATAEKVEAWERAAAVVGKDCGAWALEALDEQATAVLEGGRDGDAFLTQTPENATTEPCGLEAPGSPGTRMDAGVRRRS